MLSIIGPGGHGKTDWLTTGKEPIHCFSTDPNTEDVVQKIYKVEDSRDIDPKRFTLVHLRYPLGFEKHEDDVRDDAYREMQKVFDYIRDLQDDRLDLRPSTVCFDTGTELDRMNILSEFGRTDKISPKVRQFKMGPINDQFRGIFRALEHAGVQVMIAHRTKERWEKVTRRTRGGGQEDVDERVPGVYDRIGFKEMENIVNVEVLTMFDPERKGKLSDKFGMRILKANLKPALVGEEFWGKEEVDGELIRCASFPFVAKLIYPNSRLEDWQ